MRKHLLLLLTVIAFGVSAQTKIDRSKEILVFFNAEVTRTKGDKLTTKERILGNEKLATSLKSLNIDIENLEQAMPSFNVNDTLKEIKGIGKIKQLDMSRLFRLRVEGDDDRKRLIEKLQKLPGVLYAEQNGGIAPYVAPNDPGYSQQWGLKNLEYPGKDIHAEGAWDIFKGNPDNIIGIFDYGIASDADIDSKILSSEAGVNSQAPKHGLGVAGIAAALTDNGVGLAGVDWNAKIIAKRVDNGGDEVESYQKIIDMVNYSPNVKVLNHSWGTKNTDGSPGRYSTTLAQAFAYAYKANRTSVAAMGNFAQSSPTTKCYPAGFTNVIAVGGLNGNDSKYQTSSYGSHIWVTAPGSEIQMLGNYNDTGTSFAAPFVTGTASLLSGYDSTLSNDDIKNIIRYSARKLENMNGANFDSFHGYGMVNAEDALKLVRDKKVNQFTATGGAVVSSTSNYTMQFLSTTNLPDGNYIVKRHEVQKQVTFPYPFCNVIGVWGRGVGTSGFNAASPNFGEGFCEVVPGTVTSVGATLRTYVYEVFNVLGQSLGFKPTSPQNVTFAYTVLGDANNYTISGPQQVCDQASFQVSNLPVGSTVTWNLSPGTNGTVDNAGTVTATVGGVEALKATITTPCGNYILSKTIYVGSYGNTFVDISNPQPAGITLDPDTRYTFTIKDLNGVMLPSNLVCHWKFIGSTGNIVYDTGISVSNYPPVYRGGLTIEVSLEDSCGPLISENWNVEPIYFNSFSYYPNPATNQLTISQNASNGMDGQNTKSLSSVTSNKSMEKNISINIKKPFEIQLLDQNGKIRKKASSNDGNNIKISTIDLPNGTYFLHIFHGKEVIKKQIVVQH